MTTEEFQRLVLTKLAKLDGIENRLDNLEGQVGNIQNRVNNLEDQMSNFNDRMSNFEDQTRENTDIIKALLHRTEESDAKFDGLLHATATITKETLADLAKKEDLERIETKLDILTHRVMANEGEIQLLKKVK